MLNRKTAKIVVAILLVYAAGMVVLYFTGTRRGEEVRDYQEMLDSDAPEGPEQEAVKLAYGFSQKAGEIAEEDSDKALTLLREALQVFEKIEARDIILSRMLEILLEEDKLREAIDLAAEVTRPPADKLSSEEIQGKIQDELERLGLQDAAFNRINVAIRENYYNEALEMIQKEGKDRTRRDDKYADMSLTARLLDIIGKERAAITLYKKIASDPDAPFQNIAASRLGGYLAFRGKPQELMDYDPDATDLAVAFAIKATKIAYEDADTDRALQLLDETMPMFEGEARHFLYGKKLEILANRGEFRRVLSLVAEEARRKPPEEREESFAEIEAIKELIEKIEREEILTDVETGADLMKILEDKDILTDVESTRELIERLQELEE